MKRSRRFSLQVCEYTRGEIWIATFRIQEENLTNTAQPNELWPQRAGPESYGIEEATKCAEESR